MENKKREKIRTPLWIKLGIVFFALALLVSGGVVYKILRENRQGEKSYESLQMQLSQAAYETSMEAAAKPVSTAAPGKKSDPAVTPTPVRAHTLNFAPLQEQYGDMVGWIRREGSTLDYPIMHTTNNDYYLTHLYSGESNRYGAVFADYRNTGLFTDQNTVLYGHHMQGDNAIFGSLSEYKRQAFYDEFPTLTLYTPEGDYTIELISGTVEDGNYEFVEFAFDSQEDFLAYVDSFRARSTFQSDVSVEPGDRLISLCTCSYERNNARYMVMGRLVPVYE